MEFIKAHKTSIVVTTVIVLLLILASFAIYRMFYPNGSRDIHGDRLEGAPEIDAAVIEKIKEGFTKSTIVESIDYKTNVRIMKFFVNIKNDSKQEDVLKLTDIITSQLSTTVMNYYDIEVYFMNDTNESYPMIAYLTKGSKEFKYTYNKAGEEA